jgi:hypothetical protein
MKRAIGSRVRKQGGGKPGNQGSSLLRPAEEALAVGWPCRVHPIEA